MATNYGLVTLTVLALCVGGCDSPTQSSAGIGSTSTATEQEQVSNTTATTAARRQAVTRTTTLQPYIVQAARDFACYSINDASAHGVYQSSYPYLIAAMVGKNTIDAVRPVNPGLLDQLKAMALEAKAEQEAAGNATGGALAACTAERFGQAVEPGHLAALVASIAIAESARPQVGWPCSIRDRDCLAGYAGYLHSMADIADRASGLIAQSLAPASGGYRIESVGAETELLQRLTHELVTVAPRAITVGTITALRGDEYAQGVTINMAGSAEPVEWMRGSDSFTGGRSGIAWVRNGSSWYGGGYIGGALYSIDVATETGAAMAETTANTSGTAVESKESTDARISR
jgi:hypothetical protein